MKRYSNSISRRRRQLQVRRNICILVLSIVVAVAVSAFMISFSTQASELERDAEYKYYKSIQIAKGDTLWSIAEKNMDKDHYKNISEYVKEVKTMNAIKSDSIVAGSYIIVPYYSSEFVSSGH